ncbi:hypothetical protein PF005_g21566 [Phytophthora fragariae]|uniref:Uncharacterized protein n=1 Tax=Phytophthora fragariae TaxID=53985 RepID=A0A6A3WJL5_9STRA|nr:hypothetical protein PF005_g21566 [Phytophthora fragariae]KAE9292892.1 hypothetical protein PF008_g24943 [Phytophthora fragariae]
MASNRFESTVRAFSFTHLAASTSNNVNKTRCGTADA